MFDKLSELKGLVKLQKKIQGCTINRTRKHILCFSMYLNYNKIQGWFTV